MRIAIDARTLSMPNTGVAIFTLAALEPLLKAGFEITLVTNAPLQTDSPLVKQCRLAIVGSSHRLTWEQVGLRRFLREHDFDIYFATWNYGLPWLYRGRTKMVLAVLDLIPYRLPEIYLANPLTRFKYLWQTRQSLRQADRVVTISHSAANDIEEFAPGTKAFVFPIPVRVATSQPKAREPYLVYLGGVDPRKQIGTLIEAFASFHAKHQDFKLLLIGKGYGVFDDQIAKLELQQAVMQPGYVTTAEKFDYIAKASGLIYPSIYEGFGLTVAEAIISGTPVVTSHNSALPEVGGGDAVIYADPTNADEMAVAMEQLLDPEVLKRLGAAMLKQAPKLTHPPEEAHLAQVFKEVIHEG